MISAAILVADIYDWPPQPRTEFDEEIISRALQHLATEESWNKLDDRQCDGASNKISLYCALKKASMDVSGTFHHEPSVMEAVRSAIKEQTPSVQYTHILMYFNNSNEVGLAQLHAALNMAKSELVQRNH